jgi:AcrR family transcriptional regulator
MSSQMRRYTLKVRAEQQSETRRRIVEATAALHEEVGPARTTVAEIARRAGVQRLTVYNNFPNEGLLFAACGDHWLAQNPPPDPSAALAAGDSTERLAGVLRALYGWYRKTARMCENLQRDRLVMPALDATIRVRMDHRQAQLADALAAGFSPAVDSARSLRAVIVLALDFWTWRRLAGEAMSDGDAAALMVNAVRSAVNSGGAV